MLEEDILKDPHASEWLRNALRAALSCDPVRVANDAACLSQLLARRAARGDDDPAVEPESAGPRAR
jgi:hypothetical protein